MTESTVGRASVLKIVAVFLIFLAAATTLFLGWRSSQEVRTAYYGPYFAYPEVAAGGGWKTLDHSVYRALNGSLKHGEGIQKFWGAANNRLFDLVMGVLLGFVLWLGVFRKGTAEERLKKLKYGIYLGAATVVCVQITHFYLYDFARPSPSIALSEEAILLSEMDHIPWSLKDASYTSFPGDHGTVLLIGALYITYFARIPYAFLAFAVAVFCSLPRMVAGAHWLSDLLVGGVSIALVACGWTFSMRHSRFGPDITEPLARRFMKIASKFLPGYDLSKKEG